MKTIQILSGATVALRFDHYKDNNTIAMQAVAEDGEDYLTLTVNYEAHWQGAIPYRKAFKFPAVVIKNYSENEGVVDDLVKAGVITPGCYLSGSNGTVEACLLTHEWQVEATAQLTSRQ